MNLLVPAVVVVVLAIYVAFVMGFFESHPEKKVIVRESVKESAYVGGISEEGEPVRPRDLCISLCMEQKDAGVSLKDGPCLSEMISPGWVCDVAHEPRREVDDEKENQCAEYGATAKHFVEVNPNCEYIREK